MNISAPFAFCFRVSTSNLGSCLGSAWSAMRYLPRQSIHC
jgi:hypothetical protein